MTNPIANSLIPYHEIVQEALRAVIKRTLSVVEKNHGDIPGKHHFYITFDTTVEGVQIPGHLKEKFPSEMTIVLENQFTNLTVEDDRFSVGLSFSRVPATVIVPYAAVTAFVDPSVDFGLQFDAGVSDQDNDSADYASTSSHDDSDNVIAVDFGRR